MRPHHTITSMFYAAIMAVVCLLGTTSALAQLSIVTSPSGPQTLATGEDLCVDIDYAWASTTTDAEGVELTIAIPEAFGGATSEDFQALLNPQTTAVDFDTSTRELTFTFIDPLPAGSSGRVSFCIAFPNGVTEDGVTTTIDIAFTGDDLDPANTSIGVTAQAESLVTIGKSTIGNIQPAQGEVAPYQIVVDNNQGPGNYDLIDTVVTDTLPPGATFLGSNPSPDSVTTEDQGTPDDTSDDITTLVYNLGTTPAGQRKVINLSVQYDDDLGTLVNNTADLVGQDPFDAPVGRTITDQRTVSGPDPGVTFSKTSSTTAVSLSDDADGVTETVYYSFNVANAGNVPIAPYIVEDSFPDGFVPTRIWTGFDALLFQQNNVTVEYELAGNPGVFVTAPGSPFLSPLEDNPVTQSPANNEIDVSNLGDTVTAVRYTFDSLPVAYDNTVSPLAEARVFGEYRAPAADGDTVTNNAMASDPNDPTVVNVPSSVSVAVTAPSPRPLANKVVVGAIMGGPTDTITYRIDVTNTFGGSTTLDAPFATDVLPAGVTFVPGSVVATPALTEFTEDAGTLTFDWSGQSIAVPTVSPAPGADSQGTISQETFSVEFQVTIDSGTIPQDIVNDAQLTYDNPTLNDSSGSANETGGIVFTVVDSAILDSQKWVVGDIDLPSSDPDDLDFSDGDNDQAFETRFPDTSGILPGGQLRYRVFLKNDGNQALNNIRVLEILPFIGDIGVVATNDNRASEWSPFLIQHASQTSVFPDAITFDADGTPTGSTVPVGVEWSASTNPVRSDLDVALGDPTGGDMGSFNSTPLPADLTEVKSLLLSFPGLTLEPLESIELYFYLRAPEDAPSEAVAFNSIGRAADVAEDGSPISPAEPLKVGIESNTVSVGDLVFIDSTLGSPATTGNGLFDTGENPLPGATVSIFQYVDGVLLPARLASDITNGNAVDIPPAITDENGNYNFDGLIPSDTSYDGVEYGDFVVQVTSPSDQYTPSPTSFPSPNNDINNDNNGSIVDLNANTATSGDFTVTVNGEPTDDGESSDPDLDDNSNFSIDFGFVADDANLASIGDIVFKDTGFDGSQDGDSGVAGAVISLLMEDPANPGSFIPAVDAHGNPVADITTGADGAYNFDDLLPGNYQVVATPPSGFAPTPSSGVADAEDGAPDDADGVYNNANNTLTTGTVMLSAGEDNDTVDFGLVEPLSIGNFVFVDDQPGANPTDANGIQDANELPIVGASVELFVDDGTGTFVAVTTDVFGQPLSNQQFSDANGNYLFENLPAGDYQVRVTPPGNAGYIPSPANPNANDDNGTDSNGLPVAGENFVQSGTVELRTDEEPTNDGDTNNDSNLTVDFGFSLETDNVVGLGNYVWIDANNDGIQDAGENPLAGATVELFMEDPTSPGDFIPAVDAFASAIAPQVTGADGLYDFTDLRPDTRYTVRVTPPANYVGATPSATDSDLNTAGDNDAKPVAGQSFFESDPVLLTANGEPTDDGGFPGTDTDGALDDDNINQTLDFGFMPDPEAVMNLGDFVFLDVNGNGRSNDDVDTPLSGALVELLVADPDNAGQFIPATDNDGNPIANQTTDIDGLYNFVDLLPGDYFVRVTPPAGHFPSFETAGGDTLVDSNGTGFDAAGNDIGEPNVADPAFAYSQSEAITLSPGTEPGNDGDGTNGDLSIDFGFWTPVSLGDTVFSDNGDEGGATTSANVNNGILDGDEAGIEGVEVFLFRNTPSDPLTATPDARTRTLGNGIYSFGDLRPGSWSVYLPPSNFDAGGPLADLISSTGNGTAPDPDTGGLNAPDNDDNGDPFDGGPEATNGIISLAVDLTTGGEPITDGDTDADSNLTVDFGLIEAGELVNLGDTVWNDLNNNGILDGGETGIDGVEVQLFLSGSDPLNDTPQRTTTTAGGGVYEFDNLEPGDYFVYIPASEFSGGPLDGFLSSNGAGAATDPDDDTDNDDNGDPFDGGTEAVAGVASQDITLALGEEPDSDDTPGDTNNTVDFGVYDPATLVSLGDTIFLDNGGAGSTANDGVQGDDEPGIEGVQVQLFAAGADPTTDDPIRVTTTNSDGNYLFADILPGDYQVFIPQSQLDAGGALEPYASSNGNGFTAPSPQDDVDGDDNGTPLLTGGVISAPVTLTLGGEPDADADGDDLDGNLTVDFGFTTKVCLGDTVYLDDGGTDDTANDGLGSLSEVGIGGVTLLLYPAGVDPTTAAPFAQTITDATGHYKFDNLAPGDYVVVIAADQLASGGPLEGLASSNGNGIFAPDPDDDGQSDDNGSPDGNGNIVSLPITLTVGGEDADDAFDGDSNNNSTLDFGFTPGLSLGDTVYLDSDNSGTQDPGEDIIADVTVQLFPAGADPTSDTPLLTDVTDASGNYLFENIAPGDYFVFVPEQPALGTLISSTGNGIATDPDDNVDLDDNGEPTAGGFTSGDITLALGDEPTDDGDADDNSNLTVDFGFTDPSVLLSLGDTVFGDTDNSGILDGPEEGIPGVVVELYLSTQTPGTDLPFFTTFTGADGTYSFDDLNPGDYIVYLPGENFETGGPLFGSTSSTGNGVAPSPNDGVENDDNGEPDGNGGIVSQTISLTADDTSVDFGIAPPKATTFAEFQAQNPGSGGATEDPDWDGRTNLEEFALCLKEGTGLNGAATGTDDSYGGFCIELVADLIDGTFRRPVGISGVTYTLQYAPDLGAGTTIPVGSPTWTDIVLDASNTTSVDQGDDSEVVTINDLETLTGLTAGNGFVRLLITLDDTGESVTTKPQGWQTREILNECQTFAFPFEDKQLFGGKGTVSGNLLDVSQTLDTGDDIGAALRATGENYYVEVTEGDNIGHRFEIDEQNSTATEIALLTDGVLCGGDDESTQVSVPADLALDMIVVRRFRTLDELFPPVSFQSGGDIDTSANLLFFDQTAQEFVTYFLLDDAGTAKWVQVGDDPSMLPVNGRGSETIAPGEGLFVHNKATDTLSTLQIGTVRCNATVQPLKAGYNLLANAYPVATSPDTLGLNSGNGFTGTTDPDTADQALTWLGDETPGALGYDGQFYLIHDDGVNPPLEQWNGVADATLTDTSGSALLDPDRSIILDINAANPTYTVPAPFTAN